MYAARAVHSNRPGPGNNIFIFLSFTNEDFFAQLTLFLCDDSFIVVFVVLALRYHSRVNHAMLLQRCSVQVD